MGNFSAVSLTQIGLLIVLICWTTESTSAAISFEEEIVQLKENYVRKTFRFHAINQCQ